MSNLNSPAPQSIDAVAPNRPDRKRITVVHLIHTMAYGGIETIVINWLNDVDRDRFDLKVVCFSNPGGGGTEQPFVDAAEQAGIEVQEIPWHRGKPVLRAATELTKILRETDASIVHTHNTYADIVGWMAARQVNAKTVASLYVWGEFGLKRNILQFVDTQFLRRFDRITCQCEKTKIDTVRRGIPAGQVCVLDAGFPVSTLQLPEDQRRMLRSQFGANDDHVVLLNVARLYPEKAHSFLLTSFAKLLKSCPHARLWIAGVGPLEAELKQQCTSLGLDPFVSWLGFQEDLCQLFALAEIQVHPSLNEGNPLALLHGIASAMPIVATAVGGIPEVLQDAQTANLVPPRDESAFIQATLDLIKHPKRAASLGKAAQQFISQEYNQSKAVNKLSQLYLDLLGIKAQVG